ncbi:MAG TPA: hypothetical protein VGF67_06040 [Ktedonobacteraceae bacterium]
MGNLLRSRAQQIAEKTLPGLRLRSLTCDKALYRANRDTVRLLIAAPGQPGTSLKLSLRLGGHPYAEYPVVLAAAGLRIWSLQDLPEGEYEARIEGSDGCRFEVAEYRLAALNAELVGQQMLGAVLHYTLSVTSFGQPYCGVLAIELQERGQRVGARIDGHCQGNCTLNGNGPYTLNVLTGERSATVALKGSEQERRETLTISEPGRVHEISLLPLPDAQQCRGLQVSATGTNSAPFLVGQIIGRELELVARVAVEMLRVVVLNPVNGEREEQLYEGLDAHKSLRLSIPAPYGIVLLGAFLAGQAWEGWCAVLRPPDLHLQCAAPAQARTGQRITITLTASTSADGPIPMQLIVKDQRLAPSDPRVELAACIKRHLTTWHVRAHTGEVRRQVAQAGGPSPYGAVQRAIVLPMSASLPPSAPAGLPHPAPAPSLARVRMEFPEVIYNDLLSVDGETSIQIKPGNSMTRYTVEAFALDPRALD